MTIELRTDPSSYRHWQLSVDGPVATLTLRVTPVAGLRDDYPRGPFHQGDGHGQGPPSGGRRRLTDLRLAALAPQFPAR